MKTRNTTSAPKVGSSAGFASLAQARKAGWSIRCRNAGPEDWVHHSAFIHHAATGRHYYLVSVNADWSIHDARAAALARINEIEANTDSATTSQHITQNLTLESK